MERWGKRICCYRELPSTNTEARRLAEAGAPEGTVVLAAKQTAGRGRRGRNWTSGENAGLWFSLVLRPDIPAGRSSALTLAAALAVARAISRITGFHPRIKWPNDIVLGGKKVCGILTEQSAQANAVKYIIAGIGINVRSQEFSREFAEHATSLAEQGAEPFLEGALLMAVLEEFEDCYARYLKTQDLELLLGEYNGCLVNRDRPVRVLDPAGAYEGIARGVNRRGELLVEREDGIVPVSSGEVSVRGIYGYV